MGLFDDLLWGNKQNNSSTTGTETSMPTPNVDPALVMNEQTTSTPPAVDAFLNMSAWDVTADMPSYTDRKASGETLETSTINTDTAISSDMNNTVEQPESPVIDFASLDPIASTTDTPTENVTSDSTIAEEQNVSLDSPAQLELVDDKPSDNIVSLVEENHTDKINNEASTMDDVTDSNDIFGFQTDEKEEVNNSAEDLESQNLETQDLEGQNQNIFAFESKNESNEIESDSSFSTADFIASSLARLDLMEEKLTQQKESFLSKADEYKKEKEKFAQLEEQAIKDSKSMDDEQAKINSMRNYLKKQQKQESEITDSVNTALTWIATQKAVGNAIKTRTRSNKKTTV